MYSKHVDAYSSSSKYIHKKHSLTRDLITTKRMREKEEQKEQAKEEGEEKAEEATGLLNPLKCLRHSLATDKRNTIRYDSPAAAASTDKNIPSFLLHTLSSPLFPYLSFPER